MREKEGEQASPKIQHAQRPWGRRKHDRKEELTWANGSWKAAQGQCERRADASKSSSGGLNFLRVLSISSGLGDNTATIPQGAEA